MLAGGDVDSAHVSTKLTWSTASTAKTRETEAVLYVDEFATVVKGVPTQTCPELGYLQLPKPVAFCFQEQMTKQLSTKKEVLGGSMISLGTLAKDQALVVVSEPHFSFDGGSSCSMKKQLCTLEDKVSSDF